MGVDVDDVNADGVDDADDDDDGDDVENVNDDDDVDDDVVDADVNVADLDVDSNDNKDDTDDDGDGQRGDTPHSHWARVRKPFAQAHSIACLRSEPVEPGCSSCRFDAVENTTALRVSLSQSTGR